MITWRAGDVFTTGADVFAHGVNTRGAMGAGIAAQFRERWPAMYPPYRRACLDGILRLGGVLEWAAPDGVIVYNLATQEDPGPCAQAWAIASAVGEMIRLASARGVRHVAMPLIGCGIGGLDIADLRRALAPYDGAPVDLVVVEWSP
jgi:O-acetyl-ADP-ribose deacetylase (regulator of RNase III)